MCDLPGYDIPAVHTHTLFTTYRFIKTDALRREITQNPGILPLQIDIPHNTLLLQLFTYKCAQ